MPSTLRKLSLAIRAATDQRVGAPVPVTRGDDISPTVGHTVIVYEGKSVRRYNVK
jgi:hypothetical protein